jgi:DNA-binding transcriptional MerR regulator
MREPLTKFIKLGTLAREFDLPLDTLHLLIKKGELSPERVDDRWVFRRSDVLEWARDRERD